MLETKINISRFDFDRIKYDNSNESEIIFYITIGGAWLPEIKVKCIIKRSTHVQQENGKLFVNFDEFFKQEIENYKPAIKPHGYILGFEGYITGIESINEHNYIVFNASESKIIDSDYSNYKLI